MVTIQKSIAYSVLSIMFIYIVLNSLFFIVPVNNVGIVNRFSKLYVKHPGFHFKRPFIDSYDFIYTGFDTDFTTNVKCFTSDNVVTKFSKIYVDNEFNCDITNSTCFIEMYTKFFITDSKIKAKNSNYNIIVPEDGIIFKHIHDTMSAACKTITAYQSQKDWQSIYPIVLKLLREKVPNGINIINIRSEKPDIPYPDRVLSISGFLSNTIYLKIINNINRFNNIKNIDTNFTKHIS
jgi:hypothetical protein